MAIKSIKASTGDTAMILPSFFLRMLPQRIPSNLQTNWRAIDFKIYKKAADKKKNEQQVILNVNRIFLARINVRSKLLRKNSSPILP